MTPVIIGIIGIIILVLLLFAGIPIPFCMLVVGFFGIIVLGNAQSAATILVNEISGQFYSYALCVSSLFGLMGYLANYTGIGEDLFDALDKLIGHIRGGLAYAVQIASAIFGAICGSIPATIGTFGGVAYPQMVRKKYDRSFSAATICSGAQISTLIPPSGFFIIYCVASNTSVGKQFIAGIIPGILLTIANMVAIWMWLKRRPNLAPKQEKPPLKERMSGFKRKGVYQIIIVFVIAMGGLFAGFFTPTEAGAVGAFGMLIVTLISKQLSTKKFLKSLTDAVELQTMVVLLLGSANVFARFINMTTLPTVIGRFCSNLLAEGVSKYLLILLIIVIFFFLGMILDLVSVRIMTLPIFHPIIVNTLGYSSVWYGVLISVLVCLGGLTPPMGNSVYMTKNACKDPMLTVGGLFKESVPYFVAFFAICVLLVFVPWLVDVLPALVA